MSDERVAVGIDELWPEDTGEDEGVVVDWFEREGASVEAGDLLCVFQVVKVNVDVESPVAGVLDEIVKEEDDVITREDTLAWIEPV